jgi:N-acetylneuraminic acid mutarotase
MDQLSGGITWTYQKPIIPSGKLPGGRCGASLVYADGKLVTFGGHYYGGADKFEYENETWLLDTEKLVWHKMNCKGEIPPPRYGHSAHLLGSRMFIFGGKGRNGENYKDIYYLDLVEWRWVAVDTVSTGPSARFYHASELVGKRIVIHGGWNGHDVFEDLWVFNTDTFAWMQPRVNGFAPSPRYGHSMTLLGDGRLMLFGGVTFDNKNGIPHYNNDVRQLDTETMTWARPKINGHTPTGRYGHTATLIDDGCIAIFGGWGRGGCQCKESVNDKRAFSCQILDSVSMTWWVPQRLGKKPIKHFHNHGAIRAGPTGNTIFLFSGADGRQACNDFCVLNIELPLSGEA